MTKYVILGVLLVLPRGLLAQQDPPAPGPPPPSEYLQAVAQKLQQHLSLCIDDSAREAAARQKLQAEVEALKRQLAEAKQPSSAAASPLAGEKTP